VGYAGVKYSVITFGCRVNQADSLAFEEDLASAGGEAVSPDRADLVVVNTCSVTATADQGARQTIRRVARDNPGARIVVTGCYATRRPDEIAALPNVVRVVRNDDKPRLLPMVRALVTTAERFGAGDGPCGSPIEPGVAGRTAFTLRVQTGCDEPCAYCIIPSTRGAPRSVPLSNLLDDIDRVAAAGFREIALTGVHLGSYGRDLAPRSSLEDLLAAIDDRPAARALRFRVSSLEPMDCTRAIVDRVAGSSRFAAHFHLPLQHASDRVLAAMRRPYTIAFYRSLVDRIRDRLPHASIGTDVIVGFPGETDRDFDELEQYLAASPVTHVHAFPYSDRPGTDAAVMDGKVHGAIVRDRARRIRTVAQDLGRRFVDSQVGTVHRALTIEDGTLAVTGNYLKLRIPAGTARNEWVRVLVKSAESGELVAP
jgi:threonylcarbamoyladenosine tRNA methylthiotransferase MtaB